MQQTEQKNRGNTTRPQKQKVIQVPTVPDHEQKINIVGETIEKKVERSLQI